MSTQPYCGICCDNHSIDMFRLLRCGHGFCAKSLQAIHPLLRHHYYPYETFECPICRQHFVKQDLSPIFLQWRDPASEASQAANDGESPSHHLYSAAVLKQARYVSERLNKIGRDSKPEYMRRSAKELGKVVEGMDEDDASCQPCEVKNLLSTMVRVFDRLANLVASRDTALDDISALQGALQTARKEQHRLQTEMMQTERDAHDALNTAEAAAGQIKEARKEIQELRREQKAQQRRRDLQASEKAKETETLYETIRAHKAKEIKQAARIRELKQQLAAAEEVASANHNISAFVTPRASRAAPHYARSPRRPESTSSVAILEEARDSELSTCKLDFSDPLPLPALLPTSPKDISEQPLVLQPQFTSDWNLKPPPSKAKRKRVLSSGTGPESSRPPFPITLNDKGRPTGPVRLGSRQRERIG